MELSHWQVALAALALAVLVAQLLARAARVRRSVLERGALQCIFDGAKRLPIIRGIVKREQDKMVVRARSFLWTPYYYSVPSTRLRLF